MFCNPFILPRLFDWLPSIARLRLRRRLAVTVNLIILQIIEKAARAIAQIAQNRHNDSPFPHLLPISYRTAHLHGSIDVAVSGSRFSRSNNVHTSRVDVASPTPSSDCDDNTSKNSNNNITYTHINTAPTLPMLPRTHVDVAQIPCKGHRYRRGSEHLPIELPPTCFHSK